MFAQAASFFSTRVRPIFSPSSLEGVVMKTTISSIRAISIRQGNKGEAVVDPGTLLFGDLVPTFIDGRRDENQEFILDIGFRFLFK